MGRRCGILFSWRKKRNSRPPVLPLARTHHFILTYVVHTHIVLSSLHRSTSTTVTLTHTHTMLFRFLIKRLENSFYGGGPDENDKLSANKRYIATKQELQHLTSASQRESATLPDNCLARFIYFQTCFIFPPSTDAPGSWSILFYRTIPRQGKRGHHLLFR